MKKIKKIIKSLLQFLNILKEPSECSLYMTEICNFKCKGCRRSVIDIHNSRELSLETVKKFLSVYPQTRGFCIAGQGEPTLCSNFVEIVEFLIKKRKYVNIITNASNIEKFLKLKVVPNYISISLYGYDNKSYKEYCGLEVFDKVIENFKTLKNKFKNVGFSYFVNKENYLDLEKILKLCDEIKPAFLDINNYLAYDVDSESETNKIIKVNDVDIIQHINNLINGRDYIRSKPNYIDVDSDCFNCASYLTSVSLDGDGNLCGCKTQMVPDPIYGNIYKDKDPFNSFELVRLRNIVKQGKKPHEVCTFCMRRIPNA